MHVLCRSSARGQRSAGSRQSLAHKWSNFRFIRGALKHSSALFCRVFALNLFICLSYFCCVIPTVTNLLWIIRCSFHVLLGLFFFTSLLEHYIFIFKVKAKIGRSLQFNYYKSLCEFALVFVYMHRFAIFCTFVRVCVCFSGCLYVPVSFRICPFIFSVCECVQMRSQWGLFK